MLINWIMFSILGTEGFFLALFTIVSNIQNKWSYDAAFWTVEILFVLIGIFGLWASLEIARCDE